MTAGAEPMGLDLPTLWCLRLAEELRAAEEQIVVCEHRPGDGLERVVAHWAAEGLVTSLRSIDVTSLERFLRAISASEPLESSWLVALVEEEQASAESSAFRSASALRGALLPGQRLLLLLRDGAGLVAHQREPLPAAASSTAVLSAALRPAEVRAWSRERWSLDLDAEQADVLVEETGGVLREVERRLSALKEASAGRSGNHHDVLRNRRETPHVQLDLLGVPMFRWLRSEDSADAEDLRWGYRGVLEVTAALAVAPEMKLPRLELVQRLWPRLDGDDARKRLYPAVSHARKLFSSCGAKSPAIVSSGGVYQLNPEWRWDCDVARLRDAVARSTRVTDDLLQVEGARGRESEDTGSVAESELERTLEAAWASYRGDFLETLRTSWVRAEREEQRRAYLVVLRRLAVLRHAEPDTGGLEDVLRTILMADPIAEDAHVALMRLYSRRGRADLVRRQYDRMCSVLMDDLGLQPMDRTVREVERLIAS